MRVVNKVVLLIEWNKRDEYPEFQNVWENAKNELIAQASEQWGLAPGGLNPGAKEFGETTIRPRFLQLGTADAIEDWVFNLGTGWKTAFDNDVIEDVGIAICGYILPDSQNKISAIQQTMGGVQFPVLFIEGYIEMMEQPTALFRESIVVFQEKVAKLEILSKNSGNKTIVPFGPAVAKKKNLLKQTPT